METVPDTLITRVRVDPAVKARFPGFRGRVLYALDLSNGSSDARSRALLEESAATAVAAAGAAPAQHPRIAAWRETYSAFGAKPSAYPSSVESLLQRVRKGGPGSLPAINRLVDVYNAMSLRHLLPIGGEDLDRLQGDLVLRLATGAELFDGAEVAGASASNGVAAGEVVWADDAGVTCRRWNWRQGRRTRLIESTRNAYFIIEAMNAAEGALEAAATELGEHLRTFGEARTLWTLPL